MSTIYHHLYAEIEQSDAAMDLTALRARLEREALTSDERGCLEEMIARKLARLTELNPTPAEDRP